MIAIARYLSCLLFTVFLLSAAYGQCDTLILKKYVPPLARQSFHDEVSSEQRKILRSDGKDDKKFTISSNEEINFLVTKAITWKIDCMRYNLEKDTTIKDQRKVRYLRGITNMLRNLQRDWRSRDLNPINLPAILIAYENCVELDKRKQPILDYILGLEYEIATPIVRSTGFDDNASISRCRNELIRKYCLLHPEQTLLTLREYSYVPFADTLIKGVAKKYPRQLYDYAQAGNELGRIIRGIKNDSFVVAIAQMARSKKGQQYFPFLDNIVNGRMTIAQIDSVEGDSILYYRLLVKTQMDYVQRAMNKDTAFEFASLTDKLVKKAQEVFVNTINGLHTEDNPAVRFRIIQPLTAEELYYLAVSSDGIIYTSSFVKGVYPLMMTRSSQGAVPRGDSLLLSVRFDKYRKFIKMAAAYNTLSNFLSTFPPRRVPDDESDAEKLMKAFVGKLESGTGLEDGVDVADSYASIEETLKPIANEMLRNVQANYLRNKNMDNKRGVAIYNILQKLFLSADSTSHIDLTKELGIPPVYEMPFKSLTNDSGRVIMQIFIYGDDDGIGIFPGMLNLFDAANWKIDRSNPQWVTITSIKGRPVTIFANKPLPEETSEDDKAQKALCAYLEKNHLYPTITINRGHSYNAPYTIEQMFPTSKIVFMGSCGGYRMIHDILEKAPDAHIIGTKQIADVPVNNPFLKLLSEKIRMGSNIDWIPFWKELDKMVTDKIFEDYVPPYKNLGALFIKAYKIAMDSGDDKRML